ncbi:sigma-54-dependent Fis family transcriptional regulator [Pseudohalioglobus lutimaris]|uniref:Sigma-54-dependent Fis family transcriptional regulator n=1 Tax=Pseudohalioglobus lutimaris TaxID=1737061 RepID=A0A2N5WXN2_9GAMM|nr:sigma-54-dependent Fis family transcriptional regulator [Pseudohalioglobus lutimaris]PLW67001.1 sigma-54-dependent Fis family transcriptional regulator [Pseudohalioglobus lutimaris]
MSQELPDLPAIDDLQKLLRFEPEEGRIWLEEERMVLLRSSEMQALRKEMIESLGIDRAKGLLIRMGYVAGQRDADTARRLRPDAPLFEVFSVGPQAHMVTGQVKVVPVTLDVDEDNYAYHGVFEWQHSFEAEIFLAEYGVSFEPVCWSQIGYASGFTTGFTGRQILFRELGCMGCGEKVCRIEGRPVEEWDDSEDLLRYYRPDRIADQLFSLQSQVSALRENLTAEQSFGDLVGCSPCFLEVRQLLARAAESKVTVLLLGETGVGKDMFAKALHAGSPRAEKPFIAVNCAAIPPDLIEAELFGVEKGAYTGADQSRPGRFERAHGGTLFLDEVGELSPQAQAALLRVLQESELERVGDTRTRKVDVRLVAATNENLEAAVKAGRFRADLLYRLNVYSVTVPPLRERIDDIPELVSHFIDKYCGLHGKQVAGLTDRAMSSLRAYQWPGNIRELANMIERGVILAEHGGEIGSAHLFPHLQAAEDAGNHAQVASRSLGALADSLLEEGCGLGELEQQMIARAMERTGGNVTQAAKLLGLSRPTLDYRLKKAASS